MTAEVEMQADLDQMIENLNRGLWRPSEAAAVAFKLDLARIFPGWPAEKFDAVYSWVYRIAAFIRDQPRGTAEERAESAKRIEAAIFSVRTAVVALMSLKPQESDLLGSMSHRGGHSVLDLIEAATNFLGHSRFATTAESLDSVVNRYRDAMPGNSVQATQFLPMLISLYDYYEKTPPIMDKGKLHDFICAAHRFADWAEPAGETVKSAVRRYRRDPEIAARAAKIWGQGTQSLDLGI